jgi:hypothetical protein
MLLSLTKYTEYFRTRQFQNNKVDTLNTTPFYILLISVLIFRSYIHLGTRDSTALLIGVWTFCSYLHLGTREVSTF